MSWDEVVDKFENRQRNEEVFVSIRHSSWNTANTLPIFKVEALSNVQNQQFIKLEFGMYYSQIDLRDTSFYSTFKLYQNYPNHANRNNKAHLGSVGIVGIRNIVNMWDVTYVPVPTGKLDQQNPNQDDFVEAYWFVRMPRRRFDRNQFWLSQHLQIPSLKEHWINPVSEKMGLPYCRAWLYFPILYRMQLERRRIPFRESLNLKNYLYTCDPEWDPVQPPVGPQSPIDTHFYNTYTIDNNPIVNPLYDQNVRVFNLQVIDNPTSDDIEYIESSESPERLISRMEVSIHTLTNAMVHEFSQILFYASKNRAALEEVDEDIASDANEAFLAKVFPVGMESVFHWSNIPMRVFPNAGIIDRCEFAKMDIRDNQTMGANIEYYSKREFKQTHFQQWAPNDDLIYQLERSNLLIRPQISTLDSYIGTRVHMVLSTRTLIDGGPFLPPNPDEWTKLSSEVLYGPALGTYRQPAPRAQGNDDDPPDPQPPNAPVPNALARNTWAYKPPPLYYKTHTNGILYMKTDLLRFVNGEGSDIPLEGFIEPITTIFGDDTIRHLVSIQHVNGQNNAPNVQIPASVELLAVEYPIHNPFAMFWDTEQSGCKFYMTQIDFVASMTMVDENDDTESKKIILGEYKTLIENNEPYTRVVNKTTILQAYTNALMFQYQTGIVIDMVLILYTTRRGIAYATRLHMASVRTETLAKVTNALVLSPGFEKNGVVYYDGRCFVSSTCNAFPYLSTEHIGTSMLPRMRINQNANQNDLEPIPSCVSKVGNQAQFQVNNNVFWWDPIPRNPPRIPWAIVERFSPNAIKISIKSDIRVSNRSNQLLDENMFVMFTYRNREGPKQADPRGNVRRVQAKTIFRERTDEEYDDLLLPVPSYHVPTSLMTTQREYPSDEPSEHKDARKELTRTLKRDVLNGINGSIRMRQFMQRMVGQNGPHILPRFWNHMNTMPKFTERVPYRNNQVVGRMNPNDMNNDPNFNGDVTKTVISILTRCVQRYINTLVFEAEYLDVNNAIKRIDLNCNEGKREGTIRFIHNSQRAFWSDELFEYSTTQLQMAIQAVILYAIDFRIV